MPVSARRGLEACCPQPMLPKQITALQQRQATYEGLCRTSLPPLAGTALNRRALKLHSLPASFVIIRELAIRMNCQVCQRDVSSAANRALDQASQPKLLQHEQRVHTLLGRFRFG